MKMRLKVFAMVAVMIASIIPTSIAFAAEPVTPVTEASDVALVPIDEAGLSLEDALEILGMSEEEANGFTLYAVTENFDEAETNANKGAERAAITIPSSDTPYEFTPFSFSGTNKGAYWVAGGTVMAWGAVVTGLEDTNNPVIINLFQYPDIHRDDATLYNRGSSTVSYKSSAMRVTKGTNFRFTYHSIERVTVYMVVAMQG